MKLKILIIVFFIVSFLFLRLYQIDRRVNFSMDQGLFALRSLQIFQNKELTLIGPPASPIVHTHQFFQGPLIYYSMIFILGISKWNPLISSYVLVGLNLISLWFLFAAIKTLFGKKIAELSLVVYIFLPASINFSNFLWNPNFLLILLPVFLWFLSKSIKSNKIKWFLGAGVMAGICLQFHFQFTLILFLTLIFFIYKKIKWHEIIVFLIGIIAGYSPLLVFDLRNNFYNIKTIFEWLRFGGDEKFNFHIYYFLAFIPLISIVAGMILNKLNNKFIQYGLILILIIYSFFTKYTETEAFGMPKDWSYSELEKTSKIVEQMGTNFNVVNLLSGDTRFYSLRYLLTKDQKNPRNVDSYQSADELFVVSYDMEEKTLNNPVWEISSFGKAEIKNKWELNKKVNLYELVKSK